MAYTICDKQGNPTPLRMITPNIHGEPELKAVFTPHWWECDPCNKSAERFAVTYRANQSQPTYFAWYQLVTTDDSDSDVAEKLAHYKRVLAAQSAMNQASAEYRRLTGYGWSVSLQN
jgi:hypothetical protein